MCVIPHASPCVVVSVFHIATHRFWRCRLQSHRTWLVGEVPATAAPAGGGAAQRWETRAHGVGLCQNPNRSDLQILALVRLQTPRLIWGQWRWGWLWPVANKLAKSSHFLYCWWTSHLLSCWSLGLGSSVPVQWRSSLGPLLPP